MMLLCCVPLVACPRLNEDLLTVQGICTTYLKGQKELPQKVGEIKIRNGSTGGAEANYEFCVPAAALDRYDFRIDGQSINANFVDGENGMKKFGGEVQRFPDTCIETWLKEDIADDVEDEFSVIFYRTGIRLSSDEIGTPVKTVEDKIKVAMRTEEEYADARTVPLQLGSIGFDEQLVQGLMGYAVGIEVGGSSIGQGLQIPLDENQIFAGGYTWGTYSGYIMKEFQAFPCGAGPNGFTVCPAPANDLTEPNNVGYTFLVSLVDADIPLAHPTNFYTYSFVFDTDGDTFNDWVPDPAFPGDFFQGTDRWYEVAYEPGEGWELTVSQVTDGAARTVTRGLPTAANAMIVGNTVSLVVPDSEIDATAKGLAGIGVRYTAFRHTGDFGLNPPYDYSADVEPPVDEGLFRVE
jgi:hypothetical protein